MWHSVRRDKQTRLADVFGYQFEIVKAAHLQKSGVFFNQNQGYRLIDQDAENQLLVNYPLPFNCL